MERVSKSAWQKGIKMGFRPKHFVPKTSHGRYYYPVESDFRAFIKFMEENQKAE